MKKLALIAALTSVTVLPMLAQAESTFVSPASNTAGSNTATARLDFKIVIPQVLFLRVGNSSGNTVTDGSVNLLSFTVPSVNVGDGTVITGTGGDISPLTSAAVTVRAYGNGGNITLNSNVTGPLLNAVGGDTIPWSQIVVVAAPLPAAVASPTTQGFTNTAITHPPFNTAAAGGAGTGTTLSATGKVVRVEGMWTYTYANAAAVAAGTYGETITKNGRVTYTAVQL